MDSAILLEEIRKVLEQAGHWVTSYQILAMLPSAIRVDLISRYGESGEGAGHHYSAATFVAQNAAKLVEEDEAEKTYLFTRHLKVCPEPNDMNRRNAQDFVFPGNECCALFRSA